MKKFGEKYDLVKIAGIMVIISVLLTWVIPSGSFSNDVLNVTEITRIGIFDLVQYSLLGFYYFTEVVTFIFVLGAAYQLLSKIGAYKQLVAKIGKRYVGKEYLFTILVSFLLAAVSAVINEYLLLLVAVPFIISIMKEMKLDKYTAFTTTFGSILVGTIGSFYSGKIAGINVQVFQIEFTTLWGAKLALFLSAFALFTLFNVLHLRKVLKAKNTETYEDMFEAEGKVSNRKAIWPLIVVLSLTGLILLLAYIPWKEAFGIEWFETALTTVKGWKIFDSAILSLLLGSVEAFGTWTILPSATVIFVATLVLSIIYKINVNTYLEACGEGLRKVGKLVILLLLGYLVLEISVIYPVIPTICDWFVKLSDKFSVLLSTIASLFTSLFTVEYQYTLSLFGNYIATTFSDFVNPITVMLQSTFGLASLVAPTSVILFMGLSYMGIKYTEWIKHIWKFLVSMLAAIVVILLIIF